MDTDIESEQEEPTRELVIPLTIKLDDAALRALVSLYRETNGSNRGEVNRTSLCFDGDRNRQR